MSLLYEPSDTLSLRLSAVLQNQDIDGGSDVDIVMADPVTVQQPLTPVYGDYSHGRFFAETVETEDRLFNSTVDWDVGWANLVSSTSFGQFNDEFFSDASLAFFAVFNTHLDIDKFTQEFRLSSPENGKFEWMVGAFYTDESSENDADFLQDDDFTTFSPDEPVIGVVTLHSDYEEAALFANGTYHFSPQFDISVGARYAKNEQESKRQSRRLAAHDNARRGARSAEVGQ